MRKKPRSVFSRTSCHKVVACVLRIFVLRIERTNYNRCRIAPKGIVRYSFVLMRTEVFMANRRVNGRIITIMWNIDSTSVKERIISQRISNRIDERGCLVLFLSISRFSGRTSKVDLFRGYVHNSIQSMHICAFHALLCVSALLCIRGFHP